MQVAFPYLYNNRPRKVRLSTYHTPMVMYIKMEDPDLPAFYYDPLIHPIAFYKSEAPTGSDVLDDDEEDAFALPEGTARARLLFFRVVFLSHKLRIPLMLHYFRRAS